VLRTMTPANAVEPAGGPYGGMSTRLGLTTLAVWHASDHYGQLVMYLRMNGIVPPASRPIPVERTPAAGATVFKDGGAYGTITRVEPPFGNLDTSLLDADVESLGIAIGNSFQVRCQDKVIDIVLASNYGDVPRGEWVAVVSMQGTLKIARSFASARGVEGLGIVVRRRSYAKRAWFLPRAGGWITLRHAKTAGAGFRAGGHHPDGFHGKAAGCEG